MIFINNSTAQTPSDIEMEFITTRLEDFTMTANYIGNLKMAVGAESRKGFYEFIRLIFVAEFRLRGLGFEGELMLARLEKDAYEFNDSILDRVQKLSNSLDTSETSLKSIYNNLLRSEVKKIEDAVNVNPNATECWNQYNQQMRGIFITAFDQIKSATDRSLINLRTQTRIVYRQVRSEVDFIDDVLGIQCRFNRTCALNYVNF